MSLSPGLNLFEVFLRESLSEEIYLKLLGVGGVTQLSGKSVVQGSLAPTGGAHC